MLSFWMGIGMHGQSTQNKKFVYLSTISPEKHGSEVDFLLVDKCESFQQFYNVSLSNIVVIL